MKSLLVLSTICISSLVFGISNPVKIDQNINLFSILADEKKITAIYDSYDGETYNFISIDQYGEEFFFIVNEVAASVLSEFDLKSEALKDAKFEVHYTEKSTGDSGNTIITVTKLIKI